jgi:iron-sulfur cluster assembly accessory protein
MNEADKITLTPLAIQKVREFMADGPESVLRIYVQGGGCSGFTPKIALGHPHDDDLLYSQEGVAVAIEKMSLPYMRGSTLDFTNTVMKTGFSFVDNPNSIGSCGCGSSFRVRDQEDEALAV